MIISVPTRARVALRALAALTLSAAALVSGTGPASAMNPPQTSYSGVVNLLGFTQSASIANFWQTTMASWGKSYSKPTLLYYNSTITTACGPISAANSYYCSANNSIYLGTSWNQSQLNGFGDYAAGGILAHEWGHGIDAWLRYPYQGYRSEYHADCLAGMYTRYGYSTGRLNGADYGEMYNWLAAQSTSTSHGSGANRAAWYKYGYTSYSLAACNQVLTTTAATSKAASKRTTTVGTSPGMTKVTSRVILAPPSIPALGREPSNRVDAPRAESTLPSLTGPGVGRRPSSGR